MAQPVKWDAPFLARYSYYSVDPATLNDSGRLDHILDGGEIVWNINTSPKVYGDLPFLDAADIDGYVRVYLEAEWADGATEQVELATLDPVRGGREISESIARGVLRCNSLLTHLQQDYFPCVYVVPAGTNAVARAKSIAEGIGLKVQADASNYALSAQIAFADEEDNKLAIINRLLTLAGFGSAGMDTHGVVQMRRYVPPSMQAPAHVFREGPTARFIGVMDDEDNLADAHNVVIVTSSTDDQVLTSEVINDDPHSPVSTVALGRRKVRRETVMDIGTQAELDAYAERLMDNERQITSRLTFRHIYHPNVTLDTQVAMEYETGGIERSMSITTMSINLGAGALTESVGRRFVKL